jgi:hypothetical protein
VNYSDINYLPKKADAHDPVLHGASRGGEGLRPEIEKS